MITMIKLSPSILASDFTKLGDDVTAAVNAGVDYIHLDVMDGMFVPNISLGIPVIQSLRSCTDVVFDVHLMIVDPERYVERFKAVGADIITIHLEACSRVREALLRIRSLGCKAGLVLNPETPASEVEPYLDYVDMILLMTVHPGFGGQVYLESCTEKIREIRRMIDERNLIIDLEVDGGIKLSNVETVLEAGANVIVVGSGVFSGDIAQNVKDFKEIFRKFEERQKH